jgi:cellulose synthase (UDP-forming)
MMRPYANTLTVDVDFDGQQFPTSGSRSFAIRRDSSIDLRGIPHSVVLPRLDLFAEAGYPFTQWPDLSRTAIVLSSAPTVIEYELLFNMAAFFGAQTGSPATAIAVTDAEHVGIGRDKDIIILGARESQHLLSQWASHMALDLSLGEIHAARARKLRTWRSLIRSDDELDSLQQLLERERRFDLIVQQFTSPFRPDRSVVAIVLGADAGGSAVALFNRARNGQVRGDVAVAQRDQFHAFQLWSSTYRSGESDWHQRIRVLLFEHYWLMPPVIMLLALIIGSWLYDGTERVAVRRLRTNGSGTK